MSSKRTHPTIPDHEVLRKIGSGSYGEVWLARSVTGAMRAVKIVWREDFEDEKTFLREFEGILHYEPIARNHPGLVHILHVGKHEGAHAFYFYVMELGDDAYTGQEIEPSSYLPRTLQSDKKLAGFTPLPVSYCIGTGIQLAKALAYLHSHGLVHRDIKPSNVIFVDNHPKLADIGLVDVLNQKSLAGTEGFIPPEGPGEASGDIYALGKCLYEAATGMDRLEFPELPMNLSENQNQKIWLKLNAIICSTCDPSKSRRKYVTAQALLGALLKLQPKKNEGKNYSFFIAGCIIALFVGLGFFFFKKNQPQKVLAEVPIVNEKKSGQLMITSYPQGADIYDKNGLFIGKTPYGPLSLPAGENVGFTLRLHGFRDMIETGVIEADKTLGIGGPLAEFYPPFEGMPWNDALNTRYLPELGSTNPSHISTTPITAQNYEKFLSQSKKNLPSPRWAHYIPSGKTHPITIAAISENQANEFTRWLTNISRLEGLLDDNQTLKAQKIPTAKLTPLAISAKPTHSVTPPGNTPPKKENLPQKAQQVQPLPENVNAYLIVVAQCVPAKLEISSQPEKAKVFLYNRFLGETPLKNITIPAGDYSITLKLSGYAPREFTGVLEENSLLKLSPHLNPDGSVRFGEEWNNSLDMPFVPFTPQISVAKYETRLKDFNAFLGENPSYEKPDLPNFTQTPEHPVVNVSRNDARSFARWLTQKERSLGKIGPNDIYRLPSDYEWSAFNGIANEEGLTPHDRDKPDDPHFSWGSIWPPNLLNFKVGNIADASAKNIDSSRILYEYNDGFAFTAPVGQFPAGPFNLHDLTGNVQEWVNDNYGGPDSLKFRNYGVTRGGSWFTGSKRQLSIRARTIQPADLRDNSTGFRLILERISP